MSRFSSYFDTKSGDDEVSFNSVAKDAAERHWPSNRKQTREKAMKLDQDRSSGKSSNCGFRLN